VRFVTSYTDQEAQRLAPEIHSDKFPSPLKERYRVGATGEVRLPCDDMKVADTVVCTDYVAHCTGPNDRVMFSVQGSGDMYLLEQRCSEFLKGYVDWGKID